MEKRSVQYLMKIIILLVGMILSINSSTANALTREEEKRYQTIVLNEVNAYRLKQGLNTLILNDNISQEARQHSLNMAAKKEKFGHHNFEQRIKHIKKHLSRFGGGAENIACFKLSPQKVVQMWLTSPGHKRNIKSRATLTGIGIAQDAKGWIYYTQIFVNDR